MGALRLYLMGASAVLLHMSALAIAARRYGLVVTLLKLGWGPRQFAFRVGTVPVEIHLLLTSGALDTTPSWLELSTARRIVMALSGSTLLVVLGVLLGVDYRDAGSILAAVFMGALHPFTIGATILQKAAAQTIVAPLRMLGEVWFTVGLFNLLPVPSFNGWAVLQALAGPRFLSHRNYTLLGLVIILLLYVGWFLAAAMAVHAGNHH